MRHQARWRLMRSQVRARKARATARKAKARHQKHQQETIQKTCAKFAPRRVHSTSTCWARGAGAHGKQTSVAEVVHPPRTEVFEENFEADGVFEVTSSVTTVELLVKSKTDRHVRMESWARGAGTKSEPEPPVVAANGGPRSEE